MKKVLIAIDNSNIFNEIKSQNIYDVYERDIVYKEGVLQYLSQNDVDVIVTRDELEGEMTREIYVKQIKLLKPYIKVILFVKQMDETYLSFLYNNNIFDVIDIAEENVKEKILNGIEGIKKDAQMERSNTKFTNMVKEDNAVNVISKKKIAVFGTSGAGKSYVSSILASSISKKMNMKTLMIDLDVESPAIDIYNNLNCNNILMDIVKDVDNFTLNRDVFERNVHKKGKISYITNNASIFEYQNNLCEKHYNKIYEIATAEYDVIISDTPANVFLDMTYLSIKHADIIMFVINPNYISIRQAIKYLDLIINVWSIDKSKIKLVVNKITEYSLSESQIKAMLPDYDIVMQIDYDVGLENVINGISSINVDVVNDYNKLYKLFGINKTVYYKKNEPNTRKNHFLYNIFKKEEVV